MMLVDNVEQGVRAFGDERDQLVGVPQQFLVGRLVEFDIGSPKGDIPI